MKVNSAKEYRIQIKNNQHRPEIEENFMGCSYDSPEGYKSGFFNLFHGMKDDIERYLPSLLDIAEDNQAIYEFLQNADDCNATHFWAFYNDQYFLAVNNGAKFSVEGLSSILNIAQSTKSDSSSIGRLGIGFKLAHRLVGKGNGVRELVHGNKGPIMFSWDKASQLRELMSLEEITYGGIDENAFLLKIAITNFPVNAGEVVKDINYNDVVVFPETELEEFRKYTTECLEPMFEQNMADFSQGTLFFIKLGENKSQLLDKDLATLKNGIEYSMNTLKQLDHICFNGEVINKKELRLCESCIAKDTDIFKNIDPQYSDYDILYSFGFLPLNFMDNGYYKAVDQLKKSPNFYKYFPMGDEVDNMALFVHCDSFQIEANRRKLTNHPTNRELLPEIASFIIKKLDNYKYSDKQSFLQLYASILLTDKPTAKEKDWMNAAFFDKLFSAIKTCVPIKGGSIAADGTKVKINKLNIDIPLGEIGLADQQWFAWSGDINKELLGEAMKSEKLGIETWNINSIIVNADKSKLNAWLDSCDEPAFDAFVNEIKATTTSNDAKDVLPQLKLFKIGGERLSLSEIQKDNNYILTTEKIKPLQAILGKVGMKCMDETIESHSLSSLLPSQSDKTLFERIKNAIEANYQELNASDKLDIVTTLLALEDIGESKVKQLMIFKDRNGNVSSLGNLMAYKSQAETWQYPYVICKEENFAELHSYMISDEDMFQSVVEAKYNDIFDSLESIDELYAFYKKQGHDWNSSLTIKLINKFGATEEILSLLEKTLDNDSVNKFIEKLEGLSLSSSEDYDATSFPYRCIQLAAKLNATSLRSKITIDGIALNDFSSSDTLNFSIDIDNQKQNYKIKLSEILPDDTQCAVYGKIVEKFSAIQNVTAIFSADSSNISNVSKRLLELLTPDGVVFTPVQFVYILLTRAKGNYTSLGWFDSVVRVKDVSQLVGIISYCYDHDFMPLLISYKNLNFLKQNIAGKYLFSSDYTLENERADKAFEDWCGEDEDKRKVLKKLGAHFNDCQEIKNRMAFKNNTLTEWGGELKSFPNSFVHWVHSFAPVTQDNQVTILDMLSKKFNNIYTKKQFVLDDYADAVELSSEKYIKWRSTDKIRIFLLQTKMPYRITYDDKDLLCAGFEGDFFYFRDKECLYIKAADAAEVASALARVNTDDTVPFKSEDFIFLCSNTIEEQREKDEQILELKSRLEKYENDERLQKDNKENQIQNFIREYSERVIEFMGGGFSMPKDKVKAVNTIARFRVLMFLKERVNDITIEPTFDEKEYVRSEKFAEIPLTNGKSVYAQSAKYGIWYLSPNIWHGIVDKGNYACLCTGDEENDFVMIRNEEDIKAMAERTNNVLMKMTPTSSMNIMDTIRSVMDPHEVDLGDGLTLETIYTNRDVHLMLMVHPTPEPAVNSLFDKAFNMKENFGL